MWGMKSPAGLLSTEIRERKARCLDEKVDIWIYWTQYPVAWSCAFRERLQCLANRYLETVARSRQVETVLLVSWAQMDAARVWLQDREKRGEEKTMLMKGKESRDSG